MWKLLGEEFGGHRTSWLTPPSLTRNSCSQVLWLVLDPPQMTENSINVNRSASIFPSVTMGIMKALTGLLVKLMK